MYGSCTEDVTRVRGAQLRARIVLAGHDVITYLAYKDQYLIHQSDCRILPNCTGRILDQSESRLLPCNLIGPF